MMGEPLAKGKLHDSDYEEPHQAPGWNDEKERVAQIRAQYWNDDWKLVVGRISELTAMSVSEVMTFIMMTDIAAMSRIEDGRLQLDRKRHEIYEAEVERAQQERDNLETYRDKSMDMMEEMHGWMKEEHDEEDEWKE